MVRTPFIHSFIHSSSLSSSWLLPLLSFLSPSSSLPLLILLRFSLPPFALFPVPLLALFSLKFRSISPYSHSHFSSYFPVLVFYFPLLFLFTSLLLFSLFSSSSFSIPVTVHVPHPILLFFSHPLPLIFHSSPSSLPLSLPFFSLCLPLFFSSPSSFHPPHLFLSLFSPLFLSSLFFSSLFRLLPYGQQLRHRQHYHSMHHERRAS